MGWRLRHSSILGVQRQGNVDDQTRVVVTFVRRASDGDGEGEIFVRCGRGSQSDGRRGGRQCRVSGWQLKSKVRLILGASRFFKAEAIRFDTLRKFAAPSNRLCAAWRRARRRIGRRDQRRLTKATDTNARRKNGATLRAGFCHRSFLRCGRFHSGEEGTTQDNTAGEKSSRTIGWVAAKKTAGD